MKPIDVRSCTYIESDKKITKKILKLTRNKEQLKVGDNVRISKYKNIFAKGYLPTWFEEVFLITKNKNFVLWTMLLVILKLKKLLEHFMKKNCKKQIKKT